MFPIAKDKRPRNPGHPLLSCLAPRTGPGNFHVKFIELKTLTASKHHWSQITLLTLVSALFSVNNILHFLSSYLSLVCPGKPIGESSSGSCILPQHGVCICWPCSTVLCADVLEQEERYAPTLPADLPFLGGGG